MIKTNKIHKTETLRLAAALKKPGINNSISKNPYKKDIKMKIKRTKVKQIFSKKKKAKEILKIWTHLFLMLH